MKCLSLLILSSMLLSSASAQQDFKQAHELNETIGTSAHYRNRLIPAHHAESNQLRDASTALGIYVKKGDKLELSLENAPEEGVSLLIRDHAKQGQVSSLPLQQGDNSITAPETGLLYIDYRAEQASTAPDLKLSIKGGQISGIYHLGDGEKAWSFALRVAKSGFVELLSDHVHLILPADMLREEKISDGDAVLRYFDDLLSLSKKAVGIGSMQPDNLPPLVISHQAINGIKIDKNGIALDFIKQQLLGDAPEEIITPWLIPHHIAMDCLIPKDNLPEQVREILSALIRQIICAEKQGLRYQQKENHPSAEQIELNTAHYQQYHADYLLAKKAWMLEQDSDAKSAREDALIPLWSLQLYSKEVMDDKLFLPRLMEHMSAIEWDNLTQGERQCALLKCLCTASKLDLGEYFDKAGMLRPLDEGSISVTEKMIDEVKHYAKRFPEPDSPVLYYITKGCIKLFKEKAAPYRPADVDIEEESDCYIVALTGMEGIVAIEAYQGEELVGLATVDMAEGEHLSVPVSEQADEFIAIGWDGTRLKL